MSGSLGDWESELSNAIGFNANGVGAAAPGAKTVSPFSIDGITGALNGVFGTGGNANGGNGSNNQEYFSSGWPQIFANLVLILIGLIILFAAFRTNTVVKNTINTGKAAAALVA